MQNFNKCFLAHCYLFIVLETSVFCFGNICYELKWLYLVHRNGFYLYNEYKQVCYLNSFRNRKLLKLTTKFIKSSLVSLNVKETLDLQKTLAKTIITALWHVGKKGKFEFYKMTTKSWLMRNANERNYVFFFFKAI